MNTDYRALCAELIDALDGCHQAVLETGSYWLRPDETYLLDRARAALAEPDGPAVPEDREPASVVGEPSDKELLELMHKSMRDDLAEVSRLAALQAGTDPGVFRVCLNYDVAKFARAVLARFGHHSPDATKMVGPAAGDVAELVAWLRGANWDSKRQTLATRAADLLEQRHPAPVPVSERLPGPEDCDAEGRVWWLGVDTWMLRNYVLIDSTAIPLGTHWLPATALPLPTDAGQSPA